MEKIMKKQLFLLTTSALLTAGLSPIKIQAAAQAQAKAVAEAQTGNRKANMELSIAVLTNNIIKAADAIKKGANVNLQTEIDGAPVLLYRKAITNYPMVKLLLDHGADIKAVNNDKNTVLHQAILNRESMCPPSFIADIIKLLIAHGADVNAKNNCNCTPLMLAIMPQPKSKELINQLILAGADPFIVNDEGHNSFDLIVDPDTRQSVEESIAERDRLYKQPIVEEFLPKDLADLALDYDFFDPGKAHKK